MSHIQGLFDAKKKRLQSLSGMTITYQYDTLGRLVKTIDPLNKVTLNEYDSGDNLVKVIENHLPGQPPY